MDSAVLLTEALTGCNASWRKQHNQQWHGPMSGYTGIHGCLKSSANTASNNVPHPHSTAEVITATAPKYLHQR